MRWIQSKALLLPAFLLVVGIQGLSAQGPAVGDKAPEVAPERWFNGGSSLSWDKLKGRVILVERWATW